MNHRRIQLAISAVLVLFFLLAASRGLGTNYSYWSDELWSVSASRADWGLMLRHWLIPDTHPPLYQSLLKLWIGSGGSGEAATRSLSLLMAGISLVATALFASGRGAGRRLVSMAFLGTSPAFLFYAQESRSYATSLALSAVMLGAAMELRHRRLGGSSNSLLVGWSDAALRRLFVLACLLLSLTHYFSLLFVLVVLAVVWAEGLVWRRRQQVLPLLLGLLACPMAHLLSSSLSNKLERLDWIQVTPISGTLSEFLSGTLPLLAPGRAGPEGLLLVALGVPMALVFAVTAVRRRPEPLAPVPPSPALGEARFLLLAIGGFLALMLPVDLIKPLSQARYYIVVLPALAYLCGNGWELAQQFCRARRLALASLLAIWLLLQWQLAQRELAEKRAPLQNYKLMATFVERSGICDAGCWSRGWLLEALSPLYFRPGQLQQAPEELRDVAQPLERAFLGFQLAHDDIPALRAANPDLACWEAPGAWRSAPFILLPSASTVRPERHGLRPCP
ncbi:MULTISPECIES: hypothetical protein [unclassified Cyanobium]|uniref:hypothetical protein n=1 Tax=unclassified Cyanobium TaxID=2627006 RepID=UPI0020CFDA15|nr:MULTISPECIES: hypothetical protein [unclassified Cyanobium]MCP9857693.1 hypothetical protein [Cyanobium sp. Cruz-8H5]MCP9864734.1 hypothetical protein [Cyanobium sp. Cruz-8D1]